MFQSREHSPCEVMSQHLIWFKSGLGAVLFILQPCFSCFTVLVLDLLYLYLITVLVLDLLYLYLITTVLVYCTCVLWVMNTVLLQFF